MKKKQFRAKHTANIKKLSFLQNLLKRLNRITIMIIKKIIKLTYSYVKHKLTSIFPFY